MDGQSHFCACDLAQALASAAGQADQALTLAQRTQDAQGETRAREIGKLVGEAQALLGCGSTPS